MNENTKILATVCGGALVIGALAFAVVGLFMSNQAEPEQPRAYPAPQESMYMGPQDSRDSMGMYEGIGDNLETEPHALATEGVGDRYDRETGTVKSESSIEGRYSAREVGPDGVVKERIVDIKRADR